MTKTLQGKGSIAAGEKVIHGTRTKFTLELASGYEVQLGTFVGVIDQVENAATATTVDAATEGVVNASIITKTY